MSDIPRYKPVPDDRYGITDDADGKLCEYRYYEKLKSTTESTIQSLAANVLRLGNEVRDLAISNAVLRDDNAKLKAEVERLEHQVNYWRIEAETDNARWLRCLKDYDELRASSFVTAVPVEHYERVVKAGDAMAEIFKNQMDNDPENVGYLQEQLVNCWNAAKEGKQP